MGTPIVVADRVIVATTTQGTGTYSLGAAITGYQDFASAGVANGARVAYLVTDSLTAPTRAEWGEGVYTSGSPPTLARTNIRKSLTGGAGAAENWPAGQKFVHIAPNAACLPFLEDDGRLSAPSIITTGGITAGNGLSVTAGNAVISAGAVFAYDAGAPANGTLRLGNGTASLTWNQAGNTFTFNSNLSVTGNVSWTSDRRSKRDIRPARLGLRQVLRLLPVTFLRKGAKRRELGLIAQDAQAAHKLAVTPGQGGILNLSGPATDAILAAGIQALAAELEELRERVKILERDARKAELRRRA